jgi:pimeloyl-ACP methyl ester carboxylesterase
MNATSSPLRHGTCERQQINPRPHFAKHNTIGNSPMTNSETQNQNGCVITLHCSLGSGRQWAKLTTDLGPACRIIAPDISGYGSAPGPAFLPMTLTEELDYLGTTIESAEGPLHLVGHSYGGAIASRLQGELGPAAIYAARGLIKARKEDGIVPAALRRSPSPRCGFAFQKTKAKKSLDLRWDVFDLSASISLPSFSWPSSSWALSLGFF